jgi:hypothetical protein
LRLVYATLLGLDRFPAHGRNSTTENSKGDFSTFFPPWQSDDPLSHQFYT